MFIRITAGNRCLYIVLLIVLSACGTSGFRVPDLKRIYEVSANYPHQPPVVFIHGAFGSRLRDKVTHKEIWPGGIANLLFGNFPGLALRLEPDSLIPLMDNLEAYSLVNRIAGRDYYGGIINTLKDAGGYLPTQPGTPSSGISRRIYIYVYDWRQDITNSAIQLGEFIEKIKTDYDDPTLKVDIVSHSMGALITRYYLRYGKQDVLGSDEFIVSGEGSRHVRKVVMLGSPNYGSIKGLQNIMFGYDIGFNTIPIEVLGTMPSAYQIMPHPDRDWMVDIHGKRSDRDLYDKNVWKRNKWGIFDENAQQRIRDQFKSDESAVQYLNLLERLMDKYLVRARRFHRAISAPYADSRVKYIVFGGDCHLTPARCLVEDVAGKLYIRIRPTDIVNPQPNIDYQKLMLEPGDGIVTKPSLLARSSLDSFPDSTAEGAFPLAYTMFLCERHSKLTGNISFQDNLLNVLLIQQDIEERVESLH